MKPGCGLLGGVIVQPHVGHHRRMPNRCEGLRSWESLTFSPAVLEDQYNLVLYKPELWAHHSTLR